MGGGATQLLVNYAALRGQEVNTANSPRPVTVRAEIKIETDNGPMTNSAETSEHEKVMLLNESRVAKPHSRIPVTESSPRRAGT